jgi:hypothetical protein
VKSLAGAPLSPAGAERVFREVIAASRRAQEATA